MRLLFVILILLTGLAEGRPKKSRKRKKAVRMTRFQPKTMAIEQADSPELKQFFQRLSSLKKGAGKESMLILGDSHNQCEDFGQALLEYLQDSVGIPSAGRNYAFPYPLARTGHRSNFRYEGNRKEWKGCRITNPNADCSWGICGWLASCPADTIRFSLKCRQGELASGDELGIFSPASSARSYQLFEENPEGLRELPYVDSVSAYVSRLENPAETLKFKAVRKDSGGIFYHQGFSRKPAADGLSLGISGTNGARLDHYLLGPDFEKQLKVLQPGLILVALGTNDAFTSDFSPEKTREHLGKLLGRIRIALPGAAILLVGPPDHCRKRGRHNPNTEKINQLYSEMAESLELGFWNQQDAMGGPASFMAWRRKGLATADMVHFYSSGYQMQAKLLGRSIKQHLENF